MIVLKWLKTDLDWLPKLVNYSAVLIAVLLIIQGFRVDWWAFPMLEEGGMRTQDASSSGWFKGVLLVLYVLMVAVIIYRKKMDLKLLSVGLVFVIFTGLYYPSYLGQRDVKSIGDAAWLQQQHDNMTWLGGDVYRAHSERSLGWGQGINAQDPPSRLAVYRPPTGNLSVTRLDDWIWWLGYGPSFTQFVGKGWFYSITGAGLLLICTFGHRWRIESSLGRSLLRQLSLQSGVLCLLTIILAVTPIFLANSALKKAKVFLSEGEFEKSHTALTQAVDYLPTLMCDTGIIRQMGYLEHRLRREGGSHLALFKIYQHEKEGYYQRGRKELLNLVERYDDLEVHVQREVLRQQLRVAVNEINSSREKYALERLEMIEAKFPSAIQAMFHAQLIALKLGDIDGVREKHDKLLDVYQWIKSKNKRGVLAVSYLMLAQAELKSGNAQKAAEARRKSKGL